MPTITLRLELHKPTQVKQEMYQRMTELNTEFANWLLHHPELNKATSKIFKDFSSQKFPSAIVNQTIREVKSQKKNQKAKTFRKLWCCFNNQNLKVEKKGDFYTVAFPTLEKIIGVPVVARPYQQAWLNRIINGTAKQGAAKLYKKKKKWYLAIPITFEVEQRKETKVMGVDLGLRYIAVASVGTKSLFFKGNQVAFIRRCFAARRRKLGKLKKLSAIKKSKDKESRWMKDQNHKISRQIVDFALTNGVGIIRMEDLTDIRNRAKSKKEAGRNLHSWAFYQLQKMIKYKAEMVGIRFELVKPDYTSQTCKCGYRDRANRNGIHFKCKKCGYTIHADLNGAINIAKAISGLVA
ncbi:MULTISPECIES: RNA-guided endonuclease TnpB family protein [Aneurinibacillus]|uniref:Transposase n=1 Tax=Aneurinibacillus thermoaerophilus TaxID=143495 RepID=A0ABX8YAP9_ANETH|nr:MULTISPECIES: RNA-guided endonuclease TnpB family protein [Aneurinibacillus]AMA71814.1 transposase [Aneurinibacillus sp. XH2]MED0677239.1 transposase [Aneurinibacillus thermoaerophilus]MED0680515.1 transposase [Aneurinibacillus thermoaerophilus]MED0738108.1 transposase [Aneurinibacillus thermoaerophilus]MED0764845.1 transposase [Aneurinibacillus thermoaerophilus]